MVKVVAMETGPHWIIHFCFCLLESLKKLVNLVLSWRILITHPIMFCFPETKKNKKK